MFHGAWKTKFAAFHRTDISGRSPASMTDLPGIALTDLPGVAQNVIVESSRNQAANPELSMALVSPSSCDTQGKESPQHPKQREPRFFHGHVFCLLARREHFSAENT